MFPYDAVLAKATGIAPASIADVLATMQTIDNTCDNGDGLKWFNWLYMQVTESVENRVAAGGFMDPAWLTELDVQFATLFFSALNASLAGNPCPGCWAAMFAVRNQTDVARIQFALAGMNAHINHDLPLATIATCNATGTVPQHGSPQYADYTGLNGPMDTLIEIAKKRLVYVYSEMLCRLSLTWRTPLPHGILRPRVRRLGTPPRAYGKRLPLLGPRIWILSMD
jgi:hypothetical protein